MFRIYDDDDNGLISQDNLLRCAHDLGEDVTDEEINMMVEMVDKYDKGGVDLEDFISLMRELGLISKKKELVEYDGPDADAENAIIAAAAALGTIEGPMASNVGITKGEVLMRVEERNNE